MKLNLIILFLIGLMLTSFTAESRKGIGSIFKAGRGIKTVNNIKQYNENTLTISQLSSCLELEDRIENSEIDIANSEKTVNRNAKSLGSIESEISNLDEFLRERQELTFNNQFEVDDFNEKVEKYNKIISRYNHDVEEYKKIEKEHNSKVDKHNDVVQRFENSCAGKLYYLDDLAALGGNR